LQASLLALDEYSFFPRPSQLASDLLTAYLDRNPSRYQKGEQKANIIRNRLSLTDLAFLCGTILIVVPFGLSCRTMTFGHTERNMFRSPNSLATLMHRFEAQKPWSTDLFTSVDP
jgi:hypothetical protein